MPACLLFSRRCRYPHFVLLKAVRKQHLGEQRSSDTRALRTEKLGVKITIPKAPSSPLSCICILKRADVERALSLLIKMVSPPTRSLWRIMPIQPRIQNEPQPLSFPAISQAFFFLPYQGQCIIDIQPLSLLLLDTPLPISESSTDIVNVGRVPMALRLGSNIPHDPVQG